MIINHNLMALNANRNMNINNSKAANSMKKLSSGLRINSAADDAAGLAISEKMIGQVGGLNQASSNSQDGISMIETAEGALNETTSILQRMRDLAVQSSNDSNTDQDRKNIQLEMSQLENEVDTIGNTIQFNTKNLLDGSMGKQVKASIKNVNTSQIFYGLTSSLSVLTFLKDSNGNSLFVTPGDKLTISFVVGDGSFETAVTNVGWGTRICDLKNMIITGTTDKISKYATIGLTGVSDKALMITASTAGTAGAIQGLHIQLDDKDGAERTPATEVLSSFIETTEAKNKRNDGTQTLQIGANIGQGLKVDIGDMRAESLGISCLDVSTQAKANVAIKVIDNATQKVSAERAKLGAFDNRLQHTINNLGTSSENLTTAESRIKDVDMASEMANYSKENVLTQAAQAMLAQANQQPQQVLQLLR